MKFFLITLTGFLFYFISAGTGHTSTITIEDNLNDNIYITSGAFLDGSFILSQDQYNARDNITGGTYTFTFEDDGEQSYTHTTTTEYSWWSTGYSKLRRSYDHYQDEYEQVAANVEGQLNYAETSLYERSIWNKNTKFWDSILYTTYHYDNVKGYGGLMSITYALSTAQLQSLSEDGQINFKLSSVSGDMIYTGGNLTLELKTGT